MGKTINRKMEAISMLINQYKALIELNIDKVSKCLKNECCFKQIEEDLEETKDDFEELKKFYFNLGVEVRRFVIEYDINHNTINENIVNTFLKEKPFLYLLKEKIDDEIIDNIDDNTPKINNNQFKKDIMDAIKQLEEQNDEKIKENEEKTKNKKQKKNK